VWGNYERRRLLFLWRLSDLQAKKTREKGGFAEQSKIITKKAANETGERLRGCRHRRKYDGRKRGKSDIERDPE